MSLWILGAAAATVAETPITVVEEVTTAVEQTQNSTGFFSSTYWSIVWQNIVTWFLSMGKNILIAILILIVGTNLIKWVVKLVTKVTSKSKIEPIVVKFFISLLKFLLYAVLIISIIGILGIPTSTFIAALSAAGLTIGLALQGSLSNFAGGILILLFKPFGIGDYIYEDSNKNEGTVVGIDLCYTKLLTFDNKTVVIPNGHLANSSLTNYTAQKKRRVDFKIGIAYEADLKQAKEVLRNAISDDDRILPNEPLLVVVDSLTDSDVTIAIKVWVATENYWAVLWGLTEKCKLALDEAGIEIPFKQVTVSYKDDHRDCRIAKEDFRKNPDA